MPPPRAPKGCLFGWRRERVKRKPRGVRASPQGDAFEPAGRRKSLTHWQSSYGNALYRSNINAYTPRVRASEAKLSSPKGAENPSRIGGVPTPMCQTIQTSTPILRGFVRAKRSFRARRAKKIPHALAESLRPMRQQLTHIRTT